MPRCRKIIVLSLPALFHVVIVGLYLDQLRVELDRLGSVGNSISVCFSLDICLENKIAASQLCVPRERAKMGCHEPGLCW